MKIEGCDAVGVRNGLSVLTLQTYVKKKEKERREGIG